MQTTTIEYRGLELDVYFYWEPGQREIIRADPFDSQPGYAGYAEVHKVCIGKQDITPLFDEDMIGDVAEIIEGAALTV